MKNLCKCTLHTFDHPVRHINLKMSANHISINSLIIHSSFFIITLIYRLCNPFRKFRFYAQKERKHQHFYCPHSSSIFIILENRFCNSCQKNPSPLHKTKANMFFTTEYHYLSHNPHCLSSALPLPAVSTLPASAS